MGDWFEQAKFQSTLPVGATVASGVTLFSITLRGAAEQPILRVIIWFNPRSPDFTSACSFLSINFNHAPVGNVCPCSQVCSGSIHAPVGSDRMPCKHTKDNSIHAPRGATYTSCLCRFVCQFHPLPVGTQIILASLIISISIHAPVGRHNGTSKCKRVNPRSPWGDIRVAKWTKEISITLPWGATLQRPRND